MKQNFTQKHRNVLATAAILSFALMTTGCGTSAPTDTAAASAGTVLLSMNPEIEIEYDKNGMVLELEGINDDGRNIAAAYADFAGKPTTEVLKGLINDIHEAGYFDNKVGGKQKNIVLKLGEGSEYSDDFLFEMEDAIRQTISTIGLKSAPMTINEDDLDDRGYINQDAAKKLLLHQLHLKSAEFTDYEYELDDGVYELEFTVDGREYEFEVNAINGKVLEADVDKNDDWKKVPSGSQRVAFQDDDWDDWDDDDRFDNDWDDDGISDYGQSNYGASNYGMTIYDDSVSNYGNSNYDDGNSNYSAPAPAPTPTPAPAASNYGNSNYGNSNYGNSNYSNSNYDSGSNYGNSNYDSDSGYDD